MKKSQSSRPQTRRRRHGLCAVALAIGFWALPSNAEDLLPYEASADGVISMPMLTDPAVSGAPIVRMIKPATLDLWQQALQPSRRESDRVAAGEAVIHLKRRKLDSTPEQMLARLEQTVREDSSPRVVATAIVALGSWEAKSAADAVLERARELDVSSVWQVADRALADWQHAPAAPVWRERVMDGNRLPADRLSAAEALKSVSHNAAASDLVSLAADSTTPAALRLAASEAAGVAKAAPEASVLESLATGDDLDQRVAAALASAAADSTSRQILTRLAGSEGPGQVRATQALAGAAQTEVATAATDGLSAWMKSSAPGARESAVTLLARPEVDVADRVQMLAQLLGDRDVSVRRQTRLTLEALVESGSVERGDVASAAAQAAKSSDWKAIEQGLIITATLGEGADGDTMLKLLDHKRLEVRIAAAAGLRSVIPESALPGMLSYAEKMAEDIISRFDEAAASPDRSVQPSPVEILTRRVESDVLTQLVMGMGLAKHAPADALMKSAMQKSSVLPTDVRAAAVWSLGKLYEGQKQDGLEKALFGRLKDRDGLIPEAEMVRQMSAISLGRLADVNATDLRKEAAADEGSVVGAASLWAAEQQDGRVVNVPAREVPLGTWFLESID